MNKARIDHEKIYRLWREGYSIDYITTAVGSIDPGYIRGLIQRKYGKITDRRIDHGKIFALREAGWSVYRIAEEMKIPDAEVTKILIGEEE